MWSKLHNVTNPGLKESTYETRKIFLIRPEAANGGVL